MPNPAAKGRSLWTALCHFKQEKRPGKRQAERRGESKEKGEQKGEKKGEKKGEDRIEDWRTASTEASRKQGAA